MNGLAFDTCEVDGVVQGADYAVVSAYGVISLSSITVKIRSPLSKAVFDVVKGRVDEHP